MVFDNNTYTLNNISSTNKMLISNFDIKNLIILLIVLILSVKATKKL